MPPRSASRKGHHPSCDFAREQVASWYGRITGTRPARRRTHDARMRVMCAPCRAGPRGAARMRHARARRLASAARTQRRTLRTGIQAGRCGLLDSGQRGLASGTRGSWSGAWKSGSATYVVRGSWSLSSTYVVRGSWSLGKNRGHRLRHTGIGHTQQHPVHQISPRVSRIQSLTVVSASTGCV
jgi:hypothetical protein